MRKQVSFLSLMAMMSWLCLAPYHSLAKDALFPPLEGELLSGDEVVFPADLKSPAFMVIMSFDRDQEAQIEGWTKASKALPKTIALFEVALIGKVGGIAKFFIKGGMRDMEQYKSRTKAVMPFFGDADDVKAKLKITDSGMVHAFLITQDGHIIWQDKGDYQNQYNQLPAF